MKKKRNTIVTALTLIITLTLMLSTAAIALADTTDQSNRSGGFVQVIKQQLDNLVTAGTITQDQETAIENVLTPSSEGTSTSQKHDFAQGIKTKLDSLVSAGTITQDQETAVITELQSRTGGNSKSKLDGLVSAGTITQDQETAIENALTPSSDGTSASQKHDFAQGITTKLDSLVSAGTITQDQENALLEALKTTANGMETSHATKGLVLRIGQSKMSVNGTSQDIDPGYQTAPVIINGRTFIPIRAIIEKLGGTIDWNASDKKITVTLNNVPIILQIGANEATVNGTGKVLDAAPYISSTGRTMLPLRFITENLGHTVNWNDSTQTITIQ
jgi:competence protein ComGC